MLIGQKEVKQNIKKSIQTGIRGIESSQKIKVWSGVLPIVNLVPNYLDSLKIALESFLTTWMGTNGLQSIFY